MDAIKTLILTIAGSIIIILLGIIGFFTKSLIETVSSLEKSVTVLETTVKSYEKMADKKAISYEMALKNHEERLQCNEKKIEVLYEKIRH